MYHILTDAVVHANKPKILLAASHQDAKLAKSGQAVQKLLETELHLLRRTQAAALKVEKSGSLENGFNFILTLGYG